MDNKTFQKKGVFFLKTKEGIAQCIYEPRGDEGLEGYQRNQEYIFTEVENNDKNSKDYKKRHFRVIPDKDFPNYYECCGKNSFMKYFKIVQEF